jgi:CheY-like chemotaxis protein
MPTARIMHVDDEPEVREVVRQSLGLDPDLMVRSCASGEEALAAVREWPPDLVLLDDMMPHMNGLATLAKLRLHRDTAAIPVVFMTARAEVDEANYFKALGAAGVLPKPLDAEVLVEAVHKFLRPKPSNFEAMKDQFLGRAEAYANELADCVKALAAGEDRADVHVHLRQIAHRLIDGGSPYAYRRIAAGARALEVALLADRNDADIQKTIDTLLARISIAVDACAESPAQQRQDQIA